MVPQISFRNRNTVVARFDNGAIMKFFSNAVFIVKRYEFPSRRRVFEISLSKRCKKARDLKDFEKRSKKKQL